MLLDKKGLVGNIIPVYSLISFATVYILVCSAV